MWMVVAFLYVLAQVSALVFILFDAATYGTPLMIVRFVLSSIAVFGLCLFAFDKSFLPKQFWRIFTVIYIGSMIAGLLIGGKKIIADHGIGGLIGVAAVGVVLQLPLLIGLWRFSFSKHTIPPHNNAISASDLRQHPEDPPPTPVKSRNARPWTPHGR